MGSNLIDEHDDIEGLLQRALLALDFWLPKVPQDGPQEVADRIANDAELLMYRDGDMIQDAEELGWVKLQPPAAAYTPRDVAQILCDNSPRCDDGGCTHTSISAPKEQP